MGNTVQLEVNGYAYEAHYSDQAYQQVFLPLLRELARVHRQGTGRTVAFLAGPPAAGKSTIGLLLEHLSADVDGCDLQVVGLDGFHHYNDYLRSHELERDGARVSLASIKGAPETFDVECFAQKLAQLHTQDRVTWPLYDRTIHNPREDAVLVQKPIVVVEGNWLLLDEAPWNDLQRYADYTVFLTAREQDVRQRAVERKARGGITAEEALQHYLRSDAPNIMRALEHSHEADFVMCLTAEGDLIRV